MLDRKSRHFNRIHVLGRRNTWSLKWDAHFLIETLRFLEIEYSESRFARKQVVYLPSRYGAPTTYYHFLKNRLLFDFFHGHPNGSQEAAALFGNICKARSRFSGIRVSNSLMEELLLENGFEGKTFKIPIGVPLDWFPFRTLKKMREVRNKIGIPQNATVLGSFQKDGVGWKEGNDPKLIKGPDVFLSALGLLRTKVPELFVLLTGPARGYVKHGLTKLGIPFIHLTGVCASEMGFAYTALDAYLITSREEGGPKAMLEAMATGVPLVSTKVGQVIDIAEHGKTGWLTDIDDSEAIAHWILYALQNQTQTDEVVKRAREVAERFSHASLTHEWRASLAPFIDGAV